MQILALEQGLQEYFREGLLDLLHLKHEILLQDLLKVAPLVFTLNPGLTLLHLLSLDYLPLFYQPAHPLMNLKLPHGPLEGPVHFVLKHAVDPDPCPGTVKPLHDAVLSFYLPQIVVTDVVILSKLEQA
jgi:hypothetical protein